MLLRGIRARMFRREPKNYFESDFDWSQHAGESLDLIKNLENEYPIVKDEIVNGTNSLPVWNKFYQRHRVKFFKPKMYLPEAYPEIMERFNNGSWSSIKFIDFGCGHGGSAMAFLMDICALYQQKDILFIGLDASTTALADLDTLLQDRFSDISSFCYRLLCSDLSLEKSVPRISKCDAGIMIFTLSAVHPDYFSCTINNLSVNLNKGGVVALRDYGLYDMVHLRSLRKKHKRIASKIALPTFEKEDGVLVTFFSLEYVKVLFESCGFEVMRLRYSTVELKNKKTRERMKRVFISGVFRKQ